MVAEILGVVQVAPEDEVGESAVPPEDATYQFMLPAPELVVADKPTVPVPNLVPPLEDETVRSATNETSSP